MCRGPVVVRAVIGNPHVRIRRAGSRAGNRVVAHAYISRGERRSRASYNHGTKRSVAINVEIRTDGGTLIGAVVVQRRGAHIADDELVLDLGGRQVGGGSGLDTPDYPPEIVDVDCVVAGLANQT